MPVPDRTARRGRAAFVLVVFECGMVLPVVVGAGVTPRQRGALRDDQPAIPWPQKKQHLMCER